METVSLAAGLLTIMLQTLSYMLSTKLEWEVSALEQNNEISAIKTIRLAR